MRRSHLDRRHYLTCIGGLTIGIAGCLSDFADDSGDTSCAGQSYVLGEGDHLAFEHYGRWRVMEIDVDADRVAIWWDPTIDPSDELEWEDGERIEREGNTYTVHIDDALVLVDSEERSTRYETEETVRYHNNEWTVVAIEVETARLSGGDGVRSIKTGGSSGDVIKVAGEEYEIRLDVEGSVELCQVE